jgi:hypothetical protein
MIVTFSRARSASSGDVEILEKDLTAVERDATEDGVPRRGRLLEDFL